MASDELRFRVTADGADAAAKEVAKVQDAVDRLEGTAAQVTVEAEDEASEVLDEAQTSVDDLDGADAEVSVEADDQATAPLEGAQEAVDSLDGSSATVTAEADDEASDVLADVQGAVDDIDGESASVEIEADDKASEPIGAVTDKLGGLADAAGSLPGPLGQVSSLISGIGTSGIGAAAGIGGLVAGLGAIAMEGVNQFKNLAIEVDNFSTKTGASLDASSRFIEVAKDLDIGVGTIESSLGRMNKAAAETPDAFDEIGASLVRNDQGNVDSVETFISVLSALNGMPDASARAKAGNEIFGRGWQSMSELVGMSADELRGRLQDVSEQKIFDQEKINQGQGLRDALDTIGDAADDLFLALGESLGPAVAKLAPALADVVVALGPIVEQMGELAPILESIAPVISGVADAYGKLSSFELPGWLGPLGNQLKEILNPLGALADKFDTLRNTFGSTAELTGSTGTAFDNLRTSTDQAAGATKKMDKATKESIDTLEDWATAMEEKVLAGLKAYDDAAAGMDWGAADLDGASTAMAKFTEQQFALTNIAATTETAYDNLSASVEKNGLTFDVTSEKGRTNQKALEDVANALDTKLAAAYVDADGDQAKFAKNAGKLATETLTRLQTELGLSDEQTAALGVTLGLLPEDIETRYKLSGDEEAKLKLGLLDAAIEALPKDVQTQVTQQIIAGDYQGALATVQNYYDRHPVTGTVRWESVGLSALIGAAQGAVDKIKAPTITVASGTSQTTSSATPTVGVTASTRAVPQQVTYVTNNVIVPRIPSGRELERVSQRWARANGRG